MAAETLSEFGEVLIFLIAGLLFVLGGLITSWLIRPSRPNEEKLTTYESGEEPLGQAWVRFPIRFYLVAIIFLLFEVEIVFLFPWATVFGNAEMIQQTDGLWGWFSLVEMVIFVLILALGLAYAWVKGFLDWPKPVVKDYKNDSPVPQSLYDKVNEKYS
ncbi:MAG: NADH-quinone oxidoreductase subunit A [Fulvivirga sp.]